MSSKILVLLGLCQGTSSNEGFSGSEIKLEELDVTAVGLMVGEHWGLPCMVDGFQSLEVNGRVLTNLKSEDITKR